jgi:predicted transcriptional regulator
VSERADAKLLHGVFHCMRLQGARDIAPSTAMTMRVRPGLQEKLGRLARSTRRASSCSASDFIEAEVNSQLQIIEGIQQGLADMGSGRITPNEGLVAGGRQIIAAALPEKMF